MRKSKLPDLEAHKLDFRNQLERETDRGLALVGAAFLDDAVAELFRAFFIDDPEKVNDLLGKSGPLGPFYIRCKVAYCLGLIGSDMYEDLNDIRKIRNRFAHAYSKIDFSTPEVEKWCAELRIATLADSSNTKAPRDRFITSVTLLAYRFLELASKVERRPLGKDYRVTSTTLRAFLPSASNEEDREG